MSIIELRVTEVLSNLRESVVNFLLEVLILYNNFNKKLQLWDEEGLGIILNSIGETFGKKTNRGSVKIDYQKRAKEMSYLDIIRQFFYHRTNILRPVVITYNEIKKIELVFLDYSREIPGEEGLTKGDENSPHRGILSYESLDLEGKQIFVQELEESLAILEVLLKEGRLIEYNKDELNKIIRKMIEILVEEEDEQLIITLLSEIYLEEVRLIKNEGFLKQFALSYVGEEENLEEIWHEHICEEGLNRIYLMIACMEYQGKLDIKEVLGLKEESQTYDEDRTKMSEKQKYGRLSEENSEREGCISPTFIAIKRSLDKIIE